jgi:hypothetical protein
MAENISIVGFESVKFKPLTTKTIKIKTAP